MSNTNCLGCFYLCIRKLDQPDCVGYDFCTCELDQCLVDPEALRDCPSWKDKEE